MLKILLSNDRGFSQRDWLKSMHSFSFDDYHNPNYMNFGPLRVLNEDFFNPNSGFATHQHKNMEIITYIVSGELTHQDNFNNRGILRPGDVQLVHAGSGISHSAFNYSSNVTHLLQIWILPNEQNLVPDTQQKDFSTKIIDNTFTKVVSASPGDATLQIKQNAEIYIAKFKCNTTTVFKTNLNEQIFIHIIHGAVTINDCNLTIGDGVSITNESVLKFNFTADTEFILFEFK